MRRTVSSILALAALAAAAAPALADTQPTPARAVYVCGSDEATAASFERRYGSAPVFVTARDAIAASQAGERWATPRCMTEREHARYVRMSSERAAVR